MEMSQHARVSAAVDVGAADVPVAAGAGQTVHDFVLGLLNDPVARAAFELDPAGTLQSAGLGDLTATEVQDVVPLVADYAPLGEIANLTAGLTEGSGGAGSQVTDLAGAISQLQSITVAAASPANVTADLNATALGAVAVGQDGLAAPALPVLGDTLSLPGIGVTAGSGSGGELSVGDNVGAAPDAEVPSAAEPAVGPVDAGPDGTGVTGLVDPGTDLVTGLTPDGLAVTGIVGDGLTDLPVVGGNGAVDGALGQVEDTVGGLGAVDVLGGIGGGAPDTSGGGLLDSPVDGLLGLTD